jgi:predicted alpha/beta hydrolase family esterase
MNAIILTVPGLYNSGPQHWQTHWEKEFGFFRIEQQNWETPVCSDWLQTIDTTISMHLHTPPAQQVLHPCLYINCRFHLL